MVGRNGDLLAIIFMRNAAEEILAALESQVSPKASDERVAKVVTESPPAERGNSMKRCDPHCIPERGLHTLACWDRRA